MLLVFWHNINATRKHFTQFLYSYVVALMKLKNATRAAIIMLNYHVKTFQALPNFLW
jgi:hypothetical protein